MTPPIHMGLAQHHKTGRGRSLSQLGLFTYLRLRPFCLHLGDCALAPCVLAPCVYMQRQRQETSR